MPKEYLERGALIKAIANVKMSDVVPNCYEPTIKEAVCKQGQAFKKIINDQPTADVVEVTHCEKCKLRDTEDCPLTYWNGGELVSNVEDTDFCSYGVREYKNNNEHKLKNK